MTDHLHVRIAFHLHRFSYLVEKILNTLAGEDVYHQPDQSQIAVPLVEGLLDSASGKDKDGNTLLLPKDLSAYSGKRRADARATNPEYTTSLIHRIFGSCKYDVFSLLFLYVERAY
jgi:hypothetical protein